MGVSDLFRFFSRVLGGIKLSNNMCSLTIKLVFLQPNLKYAQRPKKLKNNKSPFSDKIKNQMTKSSLNELMPVYLKLFNAVLSSGTMPQKRVALLHQSLKVGLKVIPQIIWEYVFLVVLVNYFVPFLIKDFLNTFSRLTYFINPKLVFWQIIEQQTMFSHYED